MYARIEERWEEGRKERVRRRHACEEMISIDKASKRRGKEAFVRTRIDRPLGQGYIWDFQCSHRNHVPSTLSASLMLPSSTGLKRTRGSHLGGCVLPWGSVDAQRLSRMTVATDGAAVMAAAKASPDYKTTYKTGLRTVLDARNLKMWCGVAERSML